MTDNKPNVLTVAAASLIAAQPAMFGVTLENVVTLAGVEDGNVLVGTARLDLAKLDGIDQLAEMTLSTIDVFRTRADIHRLIVTVWNAAGDSDAQAEAMREAALTTGVDTGAFIVTGNELRDCATGKTGQLPGIDDPFVVRARVQTGAPVTPDELRAAWTGHGSITPAESGNRVDAVATFLLLIAGKNAADVELAALATALQDKTLRDTLLAESGKGFASLSSTLVEVAGQVGYPVIVDELRKAGARMAPGHRAVFWTMAGIIAHSSGNTVPAAITQTALSAAHADDPTYSLAALASRAISLGLSF